MPLQIAPLSDVERVEHAARARRGGVAMVPVGMRYAVNLVSIVARRRGYLAGGRAAVHFAASEVAKLPRAAHLAATGRLRSDPHPQHFSETIHATVTELDVPVRDYEIDVDAFRAHVVAAGYPPNYAAGSFDKGGVREQKLIEYFVSLQFLDVQATDTLIDIASEWSVFPEVLRQLSGATVYRQDLIYEPGVHGDEIGGSAAQLPLADAFADKLVLHNSFEHFEGSADTDFIAEAYRILRPGGALCILPLLVTERYSIVTDPLVDRTGVQWDEGAQIVSIPWWHNRFGRFYDAAALNRRVLQPARAAGFSPTIYRVLNAKRIHPRAYLHFCLLLMKPPGSTAEKTSTA